MQNVFKSNLNEISRERYKSEEQRRASRNMKFFYNAQKTAIKLFNDCPLIRSEARKFGHGKRCPGMLAHVATISNRSHPSDLSLRL